MSMTQNRGEKAMLLQSPSGLLERPQVAMFSGCFDPCWPFLNCGRASRPAQHGMKTFEIVQDLSTIMPCTELEACVLHPGQVCQQMILVSTQHLIFRATMSRI